MHRFRTPDNHVDTEYADLTLRIRAGIDPEKVFDDLHQSGHVQVWDTAADALGHLAWETAHRHLDGISQAVSVATNDDAAAVNEVVREQLVTAGAVDDTHGHPRLRRAPDRRRRPGHDPAEPTRPRGREPDDLDRHRHHRRQDRCSCTTRPAGRQATVDPDYVRHHLHLAYAATVHGVQGDTADHGDLVLSDATDAAAVYVGLTRGRHSNTVHIVAGTLDQAREQWVASGRAEPRRPRPRPSPQRRGRRGPQLRAHHRTGHRHPAPGARPRPAGQLRRTHGTGQRETRKDHHTGSSHGKHRSGRG